MKLCQSSADTLPELTVPNCIDGSAIATINKRLGTLESNFPEAIVEVCYTDKTIELACEAKHEISNLVNVTQVNNDPLWLWTVTEAFTATDTHNPTKHLEFEVAPTIKFGQDSFTTQQKTSVLKQQPSLMTGRLIKSLLRELPTLLE